MISLELDVEPVNFVYSTHTFQVTPGHILDSILLFYFFYYTNKISPLSIVSSR